MYLKRLRWRANMFGRRFMRIRFFASCQAEVSHHEQRLAFYMVRLLYGTRTELGATYHFHRSEASYLQAAAHVTEELIVTAE